MSGTDDVRRMHIYHTVLTHQPFTNHIDAIKQHRLVTRIQYTVSHLSWTTISTNKLALFQVEKEKEKLMHALM